MARRENQRGRGGGYWAGDFLSNIRNNARYVGRRNVRRSNMCFTFVACLPLWQKVTARGTDIMQLDTTKWHRFQWDRRPKEEVGGGGKAIQGLDNDLWN